MPLELTHVQMVVEPALGQQFLVRASLNDLPVVDDQDPVRLADRAQPVGDDETGSSFHQAQHRLLDLLFRARVHAARGLVKDQDAGIGQDRPGDGQQLPLALAEIAPAL